MPPSFASAAAGTNRDSASRPDAAAMPNNEWSSRRNPVTTTFRRPSSNQAAQTSSSVNANPVTLPTIRDQNGTSASHPVRSNNAEPSPGVYVPPHKMANGSSNYGDAHTVPRYGRDQMLSLFRYLQDDGDLESNLGEVFTYGFEPNASSITNGNSAHSPWTRREEVKESQQSLEAAWDHSGSSIPLGLNDLTEEQKQFYSSVNSTLKPPSQNATAKEGNTNRPDRKVSGTQAQTPGAAGFGISSPTTGSRPGTRRRETSDGGYPFPSSSMREKATTTEASSPFGGLKRSNTSGSGSAWTAGGGASFNSPMGSFGVGNRPGLTTAKSESRFKSMMPRDTEDNRMRASKLDSHVEEPSTELGGRTGGTMDDSDEDDEEDDDEDADAMLGAAGSAALSGTLDDDDSPPRAAQRDAFGTPSRPEDARAFGVTRNPTGASQPLGGGFPGLSGYSAPANVGGWNQAQTPAHAQHKQAEPSVGESMSPTDTNPYQSPGNADADDGDMARRQPGRLPMTAAGNSGQDNSMLLGLGQMSGSSSMRGFPTLPGLGSLSGLGGPAGSPWSAGPSAGPGLIGTPTRERSAFFGPGGASAFGDASFMAPSLDSGASPALAGLGASSVFNNPSNTGFGSIGRPAPTTRSSFFPRETQDDARSAGGFPRVDQSDMFSNASLDQARPGRDSPYSAIGSAIGQNARQANLRDDAGSATSSAAPQAGYRASPTQGSSPASTGGAQASSTSDAVQNNFMMQQRAQHAAASQDSNNPPLAQQRTMVMPDRIRWIYKDPQGQVQGPFNGLEMNDWYKAGFFTPELLIRKVEDVEYEPLAQLIRRIGNSREPFLVPQLGIPHDSSPEDAPATQWPTNTSAATTPAVGAQPAQRGVPPPFPHNFPSFGTTLTAEQQNALERRKQEEQYLMAMQKEHLSHMQSYRRQMALQGHPQGGMLNNFGVPGPILQTQGSSQSLHSQHSFGSMNAPFAQNGPHALALPPIGAMPTSAALDGSIGRHGLPSQPPIGAGFEGLNRLQPQSGQGRPPMQTQQSSTAVNQMLQDRERLQREQHEHDLLQQQLSSSGQDSATEQRARQFQELRGMPDTEVEQEQAPISRPVQAPTLTEQVQKAESARKQKVDTTVASNLQRIVSPPPQEMRGSPIPAPVAQRRTAQTVAESLAAESRSDTQSPAMSAQSPAVETPSASLAPWAAQNVEAPRGPSLREIQEMEAKKAKQREAVEAEKRRIAMEKELLILQQQAAVAKEPAPGLPSSANWAAASPNEAKPSPSAWAAATTNKPAATPVATKKTMLQIQKEEEARKQRQAATAAQQLALSGGTPSQILATSSGKRYADLASKVTPTPPGLNTGAAWTTVGAGGKSKGVLSPGAPAASPVTVARAVSSTIPTTVPTSAGAKLKPTQRNATPSNPSLSVAYAAAGGAKVGKNEALDQFIRWATTELRAHLLPSYSASDIIGMLEAYPTDVNLITETVHQSSQTIDSRHFAEEYVRRRKLTDKGIVDTSSLGLRAAPPATNGNAGWQTVPSNSTSAPGQAASTAGAGGWSDVAKKGPTAAAKEEVPTNYRVVPGKKKGRK